MTATKLCRAVNVVSRFVDEKRRETLADRALLARFAQSRDERAFGQLVLRHASLVAGVARRVVGDNHLAEDVFQATFLLLAQKAKAQSWKASIGPWLHQAAYRLACKARRVQARKRATDSATIAEPAARSEDPSARLSWQEVQAALEHELQRLPARLRAPLILCYLQERTRDEAAPLLGLTLATLKRRLESGRALLRARLTRRGIALGLAGLGVALSPARVPAALAHETARLGSAFVSAGSLPPAAAPLLKGSAAWTLATRAVLAVGTVLLATVLGGWALGKAQSPASSDPPPQPEKEEQKDKPGIGRGKREREKDAGFQQSAQAPRRAGQQPTLRQLLEGHSDLVASVAFSHDGRMLASGSRDGTIKLWEVPSGKERATLRGHATGVTSVVFSPDKRTLASGDWQGCIKLWDVASGKDFVTLAGPKSATHIAFNPDGKTLASSGDGEIKLWDARTGKDTALVVVDGKQARFTDLFVGHKGYIHSMMFSADGKILASGSSDKTIMLWNVATGQNIRTFAKQSDQVLAVAFSVDGKLASGCRGELKLWDAAHGTNTATLEVRSAVKNKLNAKPYVNAVAFGPDGKTVVAGCGAFSEDNTAFNVGEVIFWDVASAKQTAAIKGHGVVRALAFSPDGKLLALVAQDPRIALWDIPTAERADE